MLLLKHYPKYNASPLEFWVVHRPWYLNSLTDDHKRGVRKRFCIFIVDFFKRYLFGRFELKIILLSIFETNCVHRIIVRAVFNCVLENQKPELSKRPIRIKIQIIIRQWELNMKTSTLLGARENAATQSRLYFSFCIWLVERMARVSWTNHKTTFDNTKTIRPDYFRHSIKNWSKDDYVDKSNL